MSNTESEEEFSLGTKMIGFGIVIILMIVGVIILSAINGDSEPSSFNCDTMTNPTPCPDPPDPDEELYEQLKQYPDDSY